MIIWLCVNALYCFYIFNSTGDRVDNIIAYFLIYFLTYFLIKAKFFCTENTSYYYNCYTYRKKYNEWIQLLCIIIIFFFFSKSTFISRTPLIHQAETIHNHHSSQADRFHRLWVCSQKASAAPYTPFLQAVLQFRRE